METNHHNFHHYHLFLLLLTIITTTLPITTTTQTLPPSPSPSPLPQSTEPSLQPQLNNIIDALIGAGDFSIWVNILSTSNPTILPVSATLFIPQDTTATTLNKNGIPMVDPFLFPYHVVPQRLTFSDLLLFHRNSRLPTLLPGKSISVTDDSAGNFSLDGNLITHPDLYSTANVAVHGVAAVLDYSLFGEGVPPPPPPPPPPPATENGLPPPFMPIGEAIGAAWRFSAPAAGDFLWCTSVDLTFFLLLLQELVFLVQ